MTDDLNISPFLRQVREIRFLAIYEVSTGNTIFRVYERGRRNKIPHRLA
jgi:hypothetical protein